MYLSRLKFKGSLSEMSGLYQNGYLIHQAIWKLFPGIPRGAERPFLYRIDLDQRPVLVYVLSNQKPIARSSIWQTDVKDFSPKLMEGDQLAFSLRANPVVTQRKEENGKLKSVRHDVVMSEKKKFPKEKRNAENKYDLNQIIAEKGFEWLSSRAEKNGFFIDSKDVRIHSYAPQSLRKRGQKEAMSVSTLEFDGMLTVTDPELFVEKTLMNGIGPAKAFGCGLMLVKRV